MTLMLPSPAQLAKHRDGVNDAEAIQRAADLFVIATGVKSTPTDERDARIIENAILDMAWYLQVHHEDREAEFSPFSSERIGSYSYTKLSQAVRQGEETGVDAFDSAVAYFTGVDAQSLYGSSSSEWVFRPGQNWDAPRRPLPDPSV